MKALANFIMRGRAQASLVAFAGNLVPFISPATVALVTLRRTTGDGLLILLWALLPSLAAFYLVEINPLEIGVVAVVLGVLLVAALALKYTRSWTVTLSGTAALSAGGILLLWLAMSPQAEAMLATVSEVVPSLKAGGAHESPVSFLSLLLGFAAAMVGLDRVGAAFVTGALAYYVSINVVGSLLIARWWQAMLYNPGGFRQEFHHLRLEKMLAVALLAGIVFCSLGSADYVFWVNLLGLPLLLGGIALAHYAVAFLQLGGHWLVMLYIGLVLIGPLSLVLAGIGFLDSLIDLRSRLQARRSGG